jgi:hypothetical protein
MDPNTCLATIRSLAARIISYDISVPFDTDEYEEKTMELAEHMQALDAWITNGGFLPQDWNKI